MREKRARTVPGVSKRSPRYRQEAMSPPTGVSSVRCDPANLLGLPASCRQKDEAEEDGDRGEVGEQDAHGKEMLSRNAQPGYKSRGRAVDHPWVAGLAVDVLEKMVLSSKSLA